MHSCSLIVMTPSEMVNLPPDLLPIESFLTSELDLFSAVSNVSLSASSGMISAVAIAKKNKKK